MILREFVVHVVKNFGQSLMYGNQYIYQSMPRLLTLWLDYGAHVSDLEKGNKVNKAAQVMAKLHKVSIIMSSPKGFFSYDGVNRCRFFF